jgi:hypothetical protein
MRFADIAEVNAKASEVTKVVGACCAKMAPARSTPTVKR